MRASLLFSALALASVASAQSIDYAQAMVLEAYQNFRSNDVLKFEMTGTDTVGRVSTPVHVIVYYRLSVDSRTGRKSKAEIELDEYATTATGDVLTMRLVGDGKTLYRYDIPRREVTSTTYGYYGNVEPANYVGSDAPKLFSQLRAQTPGVAAYAVRLLAELNPAGLEFGARYADWLPGRGHYLFDQVPIPIRQPAEIAEASTVTDPVTGKIYIRGSEKADQYVFYGLDRTNTDRSIDFHFYDADGDPENGMERWEIQTVDVGLRTGNRLLSLQIVPNMLNPLLPGFPTGTFQPYSGSLGAQFRPITRGQ